MMNQNDITILIADDDPDYLFQMRIIIEGFGYNTITAGSQRECEKIIASMKPDLAILDLMMEHEDSGFILSYKNQEKVPRRTCYYSYSRHGRNRYVVPYRQRGRTEVDQGRPVPR
ncbi:MAG: response regulator [Bacteroidales bacterium]|nr:response regulator [Bacteroidales bacterium]